MNETVKILLGVVVISIGLIYLGYQITDQKNFSGMSFQNPSYGVANITYGQVSCNTTTTALLATASGRLALRIANTGAGMVYICKSSGVCTATSGIPIYGTSSNLGVFVQDDGYTGPYRCAGVAATTVTYEEAK